MPADCIEQKTDGPGADRVDGAGETANYKHIVKYGDDAAWPNVVWIIIGILSIGGLVVFLLLQ